MAPPIGRWWIFYFFWLVFFRHFGTLLEAPPTSDWVGSVVAGSGRFSERCAGATAGRRCCCCCWCCCCCCCWCRYCCCLMVLLKAIHFFGLCVSVLVCVVRVRWFLSLWKRWIIVDIKNRLASIDCIMGRRYNTTKPCFYRIFPIVSLRKKKLRLWRWSDRRSGDQRWRVLIFSSWFSFRIICFIFLLFHAARFLFNRCHVIFRLQPRVLFLI